MLKNIFDTFANCFKIPELKSRIFYTLGLLAVCRVLAYIPVPGVNGGELTSWMERQHGAGGGLTAMYSMFTGGALEKCAVGALGIMPYISATIILQLLGAVIPQLSKLMREEGGRAKIIQYGRYLTVVLCFGWGTATAVTWEHPQNVWSGFPGQLVTAESIWWYRIQTIVVLTTGTMLLMWLGEQITERGIGNGVSLVITVGIVARLPQAGQALMDMFTPGKGIEAKFNYFQGIALILLLVAVVAGVISLTQAQRKIPVQYAQRAVGRKVYQGGSSFMPLRVNYSGVMPIIFAQSILMFPERVFFQLGQAYKPLKFLSDLAGHLREGALVYMIVYGMLILFFSYFWVATQFNELQIADDLKKYGGYVPGVRPGTATSDFLHNSMSRITLAGAIFLTVIALIPIMLNREMQIPWQVGQFFGGTSMLITVGVMLDTMRQMESHLLMRHYDGFMKKGRLKGRF